MINSPIKPQILSWRAEISLKINPEEKTFPLLVQNKIPQKQMKKKSSTKCPKYHAKKNRRGSWNFAPTQNLGSILGGRVSGFFLRENPATASNLLKSTTHALQTGLESLRGSQAEPLVSRGQPLLPMPRILSGHLKTGRRPPPQPRRPATQRWGSSCWPRWGSSTPAKRKRVMQPEGPFKYPRDFLFCWYKLLGARLYVGQFCKSIWTFLLWFWMPQKAEFS